MRVKETSQLTVFVCRLFYRTERGRPITVEANPLATFLYVSVIQWLTRGGLEKLLRGAFVEFNSKNLKIEDYGN